MEYNGSEALLGHAWMTAMGCNVNNCAITGEEQLRREAGEELQHLRQACGLSQADLARILEIQQKTFISQLETGRRRIPPEKYTIMAQALSIDPAEFVKRMMRFYDPVTYEILFTDTFCVSK